MTTRHLSRRAASALAAGLIIATLAASPVAAGNPTAGNPAAGTVSYSMGVDLDGDGVLSWNDTIHLTAVPPTGITYGDIQMVCYTGWRSLAKRGTLVYSAYWVFNNTWVRDYQLDSLAWNDNTAVTCVAFGFYPDGRHTRSFGEIVFTVAA